MKKQIRPAVQSPMSILGVLALLYAGQTLAEPTENLDTTNQATPVTTQQDRNINQPNSFGPNPSDRENQQNNPNAAANTQNPSESGIADTANEEAMGNSMARGTLSNQGADGTTMVHISTGDNQIQTVSVNSLLERNVVNLQGKTFGEVESVVQPQDGGTAALVVEAGGFLGIGEKELTIPLDEIRMEGDRLIWETQMNISDAKKSEDYHYEKNRYISIADD